jgi:hypothetical protein
MTKSLLPSYQSNTLFLLSVNSKPVRSAMTIGQGTEPIILHDQSQCVQDLVV